MTQGSQARLGRRGFVWLMAAVAIGGLGLRSHAAVSMPPVANLEVTGLEVRVLEVGPAIEFFRLFGFVADGPGGESGATLRNGAAVIDLVKAGHRVDIDDRAVSNTHINLRVESLDTVIAELRDRPGYRFVGELRQPFPLGHYAVVKDPSGNTFHLIEPASAPPEGIQRGIFNIGITLTDMVAARTFYRDKLGFEIFSEDYFPPDLPLKRRGTLPLVLHQTAERPAASPDLDAAAAVVVLGAADFDAAAAALKERGVRFLEDQPRPSRHGRTLAFSDPFGIVFQLREREIRPSR